MSKESRLKSLARKGIAPSAFAYRLSEPEEATADRKGARTLEAEEQITIGDLNA